MVTREAYPEMVVKGNDLTRLIYRFELAQQAPALAMMLRGIRIDKWEVKKLLDLYISKMKRIQWVINQLADVVWGKPLNPLSPKQLMEFFYERMSIPTIYKTEKGIRKPTCNEEALEKIQAHFYAAPIARAILLYKDYQGKAKVLKSGIDKDHRMRFSFNIGGAETGRWSSSKNIRGGGTNAQNITEKMRRIFIADEGKLMAYIDLEQAESRAVAYVSGDEEYIKACESGDLHTAVCAMVWPDKDWSSELKATGVPTKADKRYAESLEFDRLHSFRYMAKQSGHSSNYLISAFSLAKHNKIEQIKGQEFQDGYFGRFKGIKKWHHSTAEELVKTGALTTPVGRRRVFFGRRTADKTLRDAVAHVPQSLVADVLNLGLLFLWLRYELQGLFGLELLAQVHDAVLLQVDEDQADEAIPILTKTLEIPIPVKGRVMVIPAEAKVGYNWYDLKPFGSEEAKALKRQTSYNENILDRPILTT